MRVLRTTITYPSRSDEFVLYPLFDTHMGARTCDEKLLRQHVAAIAKNPNARWIGGGDYIEAIPRKGDSRYNEETIATWLHGQNDVVELQIERIVDILTPITDKCLGLIKGNHEDAVEKWHDRAAYRAIAKQIARAANKEPEELMLGVQGFVVLSLVRQMSSGIQTGHWRIPIYLHHGYGGGRLPGGHALTLGRVLSDYDCDLAFLGHRHTNLVLPKIVMKVSEGEPYFCEHTKYACFVPSYMRAYITDSKLPVDSYAENFGLPPQPVGTFPVVLKPDKRKISIVTSFTNG